MPRAQPATPAIEIILPDGQVERLERRSTPTFRPYSALDGCPPGLPGAVADRRRRRRTTTDHRLGRKLDLTG